MARRTSNLRSSSATVHLRHPRSCHLALTVDECQFTSGCNGDAIVYGVGMTQPPNPSGYYDSNSQQPSGGYQPGGYPPQQPGYPPQQPGYPPQQPGYPPQGGYQPPAPAGPPPGYATADEK